MVFFKALKMQEKSKISKTIQYYSIFELTKLSIQTPELYKAIYSLKVHLEHSFSHIN